MLNYDKYVQIFYKTFVFMARY